MSIRGSRILAVLCGIVLTVAGCEPLDEAPPGGGQGAVAARQQLDALTVAAWGSMARYSRDRFRHWSRQGQGCDTRDVVLKRDGEAVRTTEACEITRGTWFSPYDGRTVSDPQDIDIDHMVPLANAWRTGASAWSDEKRADFANDLSRPELIAVTSTTNRSKGDQDPSQWQPPRRDFWCVYAQNWVVVKSHWKLNVTVSEKTALTDMLGMC